MTCNRCLQEIIEGESFWEDEAEGTAYHNDCRRAAIDRRNKAEDERAAALARAEAAEAEAVQVHRQLTELATAMEEIEDERLALTARVAELEAATAWRPVTEEPPSLGYYLTVDFYGAYGICYYENGEWQSFDYSGYQPTDWRPLPPSLNEATTEAHP